MTNIWISKNASIPALFEYDGGLSFVYNNKLYLGLGSNTTTGTKNVTFKVYDPEKNAWEDAFSTPSGFSTRFWAICVVKNSKLYIGGGKLNYNTSLTDLWEYDLQNGVWKREVDLPVGMIESSAFVLNDKIYMGLGYMIDPLGQTYNDKLYEFDPIAGGSWLASYNVTGDASAESFVINDVAFYGGGNEHTGVEMYSFNPSGSPVNKAASSLTFTPDVSNTTSFVFNNKGYFLAYADSKFYVYDPSQNKWTDLHSFPVTIGSSEWPIYSGVLNNKIYVCSAMGNVFQYIPNY